MSSPSSYHFLSNSSSASQGDFFRIFVTDDKITVYRKRKIRTLKSGVLFEKVLTQRTFKLCVNKNGDKYLQVLNKTGSGKFNDYALMGTLGLESLYLPKEARELVDGILLGWFGDLYKKLSTVQHDTEDGDDYSPATTADDGHDEVMRLFFPAFRDPSFPSTHDEFQIGTLIRDLHESTGKAVKTLRDYSSWEGFVKAMCGNTVQTNDDVALLRAHPALLHIARSRLGVTISEFNALANGGTKSIVPAEDLKVLCWLFNWKVYTILDFMFKYLPADQKSTMVNSLLELVRVSDAQKLLPIYEQRLSHHGPLLPLSRVPMRSRRDLAKEISEVFLTACDEAAQIDKEHGNTVTLYVKKLDTQLKNLICEWFASTITMPSLVTTLTAADIQNRFTEIMGEDFPVGNQFIKFYSVDGVEFCTKANAHMDKRNRSLLAALLSLAKSRTARGLNAPSPKGTLTYSGYIEKGQFVESMNPIYSLGDIMAMLEEAVTELDRRLVKLGREITTANRVAYLSLELQTFGAKERDYKNTWFYYDLGITEVSYIVRYKQARIRSKKDVLTFKELSPELFDELTALASARPNLLTLPANAF